MRAEIISIGTEILLGEIQDTNAAYLAARLPALGIDLYHLHGVGDNLGRIVDVFRLAWSRSDLVLCTGGLGPTEDDVTREAIAKLVGEEPAVHPDLEKELRAYFSERNVPMPLNNLRQATLIPSGQAIPNPVGTAPGWWVEKGGKLVIAMPGPPREMYRMWESEVRPRLRGRLTSGVLVTRTLKTTGISEGAVDEMAGELLRGTDPTIGVYARADGIHLRLAAKGKSEAEAQAKMVPVEARLRAIFGDHLWGADDETLEGAVGRLLKERGLTLAVMESCTGGLLASRITDVPGSSAYFKGGTVTYTVDAKVASGVDRGAIEKHGVISAETAAAMAAAARRDLAADVGVGITGVAGPDEQEGQPVGTVFICAEGPRGSLAAVNRYRAGRLEVKQRAVNTALSMVRRLAAASG